MTCTILKGNLEKFLKIQENLNFLQKIENLKVLQAEFQASFSYWRSKIGFCEKCLKLLKKFVIFEFLSELLCKRDLSKLICIQYSPKPTAWKTTEGQDLQISSKNRTKKI